MKYVLKIGIILVICISIVFILPNEFSFVCAAGSTSYKGLLGKATPKDGDMPTTAIGFFTSCICINVSIGYSIYWFSIYCVG